MTTILYPTRPKIVSRIGYKTLPREVVDLIENGRYENAADTLVIGKFPFNEAVKLLQNCPLALSWFYYKTVNSVSISSSVKQIVAHLYLETQLSILSTIPTHEKQKELSELRKFINDYKGFQDADTVIKMIINFNERSILPEAYISFGEIEKAINYYISNKDFTKIKTLILQLPIEKQRQCFLCMIKNNKQIIFEMIEENMTIQLGAFYDALVTFTLLATQYQETQKHNIVDTFGILSNYMTEKIEFSLYFILLYKVKTAATKEMDLLIEKLKSEEKPNHQLIRDIQKMEITEVVKSNGYSSEVKKFKYYHDGLQEFMKDKIFQHIDADYVVKFVIKEGDYVTASKIYARVPDRHLFAVKYSLKTIADGNISNVLSLIKDDLKGSKDLKQCWVEALTAFKGIAALTPGQWESIVKGATQRQVLSLDDIFPFVPATIPLDDLQKPISSAVRVQSEAITRCEQTSRGVEAWADAQRRAISEGGAPFLRVDPCSDVCALCGQGVCDATFDAYPCGHKVHMQCFLANLTNYVDPSEVKLAALNDDRINELYERLVTKSCPACGTAAVTVLHEPFIIDEEMEEKARWDVPL